MSLQICSLNSGSNGNCYYIGNSREAVLIDAGLSVRETERRMKLRELSVEKVKAIFVTHEHADHISGVPGLSKKYQLPVYITEQTFRNSNIPLAEHLVCEFNHAKPVSIGSLEITPFKKSHDAADPYSFLVSGNGINVGVITDIGYACKRVLKYFGQCHAAFLESNYCDEMLRKGSYPFHLQERIRGDEGHLSNAQALELFQHYKSPELQLLILSHLSKNNNKPELVEKLFTPYAGDTKIIVASRYEAGQVFSIENTIAQKTIPKKFKKVKNQQQLSLF